MEETGKKYSQTTSVPGRRIRHGKVFTISICGLLIINLLINIQISPICNGAPLTKTKKVGSLASQPRIVGKVVPAAKVKPSTDKKSKIKKLRDFQKQSKNLTDYNHHESSEEATTTNYQPASLYGINAVNMGPNLKFNKFPDTAGASSLWVTSTMYPLDNEEVTKQYNSNIDFLKDAMSNSKKAMDFGNMAEEVTTEESKSPFEDTHFEQVMEGMKKQEIETENAYYQKMQRKEPENSPFVVK